MAKRTRARRGLAGVPTETLQAELRRRQSGVRLLERTRDRLMSKLSALESRISDYGGAMMDALGAHARGRTPGRRGPGRPRGGGGRRPRNEMNLVQALGQTLKGKTMSVTEVSEAVQRHGYRTTSPNFRTIVNQALIKNRSQFRKVSRGKYTAR